MKIIRDARAFPRENSQLRARITFNKGFTSINCLVRNFSRAGANLILPGNEPLPREFELHMPSMHSSYQVALVWRDEDSCGVEFLRSLPSRGNDLT